MRGFSIVTALLLLAGAALANDIRTERVQFARGATSAVVEGHIAGHHGVDYRLRAAAGQTMQVTLDSRSTDVTFNIIAPGETDAAFHIGSIAGNRYEGRLPRDGDYRIRVHLSRAAAQQNRAVTYRIEIGVTGAPQAHPAAPAAGHDREPAAQRAGEGRFDATAEVPCADGVGQPTRPCPAGVARDPGGAATVVVTRPDGRKRAIFFQHGRPVAADVSQADGDRPFSATREGDLNLIRIGPERYEIPDAFPLGG
jgi:hypothetical protein